MENIESNGGLESLKRKITDQSILYTSILTVLTYFPFSKIYSVKFISILFDVGLSIINYYIIRKHYNDSEDGKFKGLICAVLTLFVPTIFMNSAVWGQCDSIYAFFLMTSILFFLNEKFSWAMIFYGLSISFKLQAIFLFPFLVYSWISKGEPGLKNFLLIPVVFLLSTTPALIAGRPLLDILTIYSSQAALYPSMTLNFASLYSLFPNDKFQFLGMWSISLYALIFGLIIVIGTKRNFKIPRDKILEVCLWVISASVFLLPSMHERYMYVADVIGINYLLIRPAKWYIGLSIISISTFCYFPFLFGTSVVDLRLLSACLFFTLVALAKEIINGIEFRSQESVTEQKTYTS